MNMRPKWLAGLVCPIVFAAAMPLANSQPVSTWNDAPPGLFRAAMKPPKCGDHLQGTEAMPLSRIPLKFQIMYEEQSANECLRQGDNGVACGHFRRALAMLNSEYPYQAHDRASVQALVDTCNW